jgi:glycosyl hydrolase family 15
MSVQLDIFGEIADAMFQTLKAGMAHIGTRPSTAASRLDYLATAWRQPQRARPTGPSGAGRAPAIRPAEGRCPQPQNAQAPGLALGLFLQSLE